MTQQLDSEEIAWIKSMFAQWSDAPVVEPQGPLVSGWLADVNTGDFIATDWGNTVRNRTVTPFASVAARNAAMPAATAPLGSYCVTLDTGSIWELNDRSGARLWTPPWNTAWGILASGLPNQSNIGVNVETDINGTLLGFPGVRNRTYEYDFNLCLQKDGTAFYVSIALYDGTNQNLGGALWVQSMFANGLAAVTGSFPYVAGSSAPSSLKLRLTSPSGACNVVGPRGVVMVKDIGPAGYVQP